MGGLTIFDNFYKRTLESIPLIFNDLPFNSKSFYTFIFSLEYSIYSAIIYIPLIIFLNSTLIPYIKTNFGNKKSKNFLIIFIMVIIMQTTITILTNSIRQIIFDLPSIIEYESKDKEEQKKVENIRDSSIKQGIGISSSLLIVPFLVSLTEELGLNNITWEEITSSIGILSMMPKSN